MSHLQLSWHIKGCDLRLIHDVHTIWRLLLLLCKVCLTCLACLPLPVIINCLDNGNVPGGPTRLGK